MANEYKNYDQAAQICSSDGGYLAMYKTAEDAKDLKESMSGNIMLGLGIKKKAR